MPKLTSHPGVWLSTKAGEYYARWVDPDTNRECAQCLTRFGLLTAAARTRWAENKSATLLARLAELAHGQPTRVETAPKSAIAQYLDDCAAEGLRPVTIKCYRQSLARFAAWCASTGVGDVHELTETRWAQFRSSVTRTGRELGPKHLDLSPHSLNRRLRDVRAFAFWLRRRRLVPVDRDTISDALRPLKTERTVVEYFSPETLRAILAAPSKPIDAAFAAVCLLSGARCSEVLAMRRSHLNVAQHEILVSGKTGQRAVDLSISPALLNLLTALADRGDVLLPGIETPQQARAASERTWKAGAPRWTPQQMRQTCATYLVALRGASWESQQLGHTVLIAERNYVGRIRRIDAAAKTIEAAMGVEREVATVTARCLQSPTHHA